MTYLLHISDLHLVTDPLWNNMKNVILDSVRKQLENVPLGEKLLVITGDFHNFVEKNFDQAKEFLPQLIDAMGIEADKDVFVIPGNHDVSNKIPAEIDRRIIITGVKSDPNMLHERVEQLLSCYEPYIEMIKSVKVYQEDSGRLPVRVHVRTWRKKLHLLHLNTSLIADGKTKDGQMTDELTATSDEIRKKLRSGGLPCIAIGHNSFFDLSERQQKMLTGMFSKENISAYLCGDRHQRNTERKENRISLGQKYSSVSIPNIVSYRTSTDENDEYSDFGMIWHIWNEETGRVDLKFMRWDPDDQGELQPDGEDFYNFRYALQASTGGKSQASTGTTNTCWLSNSDLLRSKSSSVKPNHIQGFLLGGRCGWNLAFSDKIIVERNIVDTLYQYAVNGGVHALTGPGGEGKSTVLMQMCAKLVKSGVSVFYYRGYGRLDLPEEVPENSVFVLDNPPDRPDFKQFLDTVIGYGYTLILGARENEWNLLKKSLRISDRDVLDVPMQTLTAKEAWAFADCVCNNLRHSKSRREIKEIFQTRSYGFLYAAMLMAVSDKNSLEEIAHEIVSNLSERSMDALHLLAHIVLSEHYNVRFEYEQFRYVCNKLKLSPGDGRSALSREISLNGGVYQTRHERISKLFFEELFSDSGLLDSEDIDNVLTNLFELHLANYRSAYGHLKNKFKNSIMQLSGGLAYASINAQQYLINRIIDEVKAQPPRYFDQLPLYINDEGVQLLFYRQCFDRKWISSASLRNWCHLLLKKGSPWTTLEPYFPAWIMRKACIKRSADSNAWMAWAQLESKHGKIGDYESENTARWIFREACINHNADGSVWMAWAQLEVQQNNVGDYESENTARWIFRKACVEKNTDGKVWLAWAQLEAQQNNVGDCESENTARWIFRKACVEHKADGQVWLAWAQLEAQQGNVGDCESENTARWILRKACVEKNTDGKVWLAWAQLEAQQNNVGDCESENTARWIFRKACVGHNANGQVWKAWAQLEAQQNNVGDCESENTARWILREACINRKADSNAWMAWAQLESQYGKIGDYESENTARWILREACINRKADSNTWLAWAQLEAQQNDAGDYESENTARWIFWEACINHNAGSHTWLAWAQLEAQQNNVGDYESENTARWIFRKACGEQNTDGKVWLAWAQLEAQQNNVGDYERENTARWIFREACINHNADSNTWLAWAQLEAQQNNVGDYESENTARWIYSEGIKRFPNAAALYLPYANMEVFHHSAGRARDILRQALQYSDYSIGSLAVLEFFYGNIDSGDTFCTKQLMVRMDAQKDHSVNAIKYLYHCSLLLNQTEEAAHYHKLLMQRPDYDPSNTKVGEFIQMCKEAVASESAEKRQSTND